MSTEPSERIVICGWCPTELPDSYSEVQHHFFIAHNQPTSQSARYVYPDQADDELAALIRREARRG